ncbi:hypothetical protein AAF712_007288 [Marasmius tenuissimus]|uniref:VOC domain-containing protein n=1 Tax=Marasmius tenuissimus TaxID=585030 RepID=A0ABR2ZX63_9AGAR
MPIDHTGISVLVSKLATVVAWYEAALKPVGYKKSQTLGENGEYVGFSDAPVTMGTGGGRCDWWIGGVPDGGQTYKGNFAFSAKDRATVDAFYAAGIAAGGKDNGAPGLREYSSPSYYGASVVDPAGNSISVVCYDS